MPLGFSVSVAGIVVADDSVLLTQRANNGAWEPPGGILERGETFIEGVRREVLEETGILVEPHLFTGCYLNMSAHVVALVFRCTALTGQPRTSAETRDVRWVRVEEAASWMSPAFSVRVEDAIGSRGETMVRYHDGTNLIGPPLH
ncbi:NUDIX hydrolase [Mycolicibacterium goodii]|nr:NUDIX hydrolase [Mycolicibacterium goodii]